VGTKLFRVPYRYIETFRQDTQCTYKRNIEARSRNHCCREIAISITYSEYVSVALVIRHAKRMRRICFFVFCHLWHV
jgi:phosphopantetheinyl transferase (holo-ACP synthase)